MTDWTELYDKFVWVQTKPKSSHWPSLVCNPDKLYNVHESVRSKGISYIGKKYVIKYLGMPDNEAYGFIPKSQIKLFQGSQDPLLKQSCGTRYAAAFKKGLKMIENEDRGESLNEEEDSGDDSNDDNDDSSEQNNSVDNEDNDIKKKKSRISVDIVKEKETKENKIAIKKHDNKRKRDTMEIDKVVKETKEKKGDSDSEGDRKHDDNREEDDDNDSIDDDDHSDNSDDDHSDDNGDGVYTKKRKLKPQPNSIKPHHRKQQYHKKQKLSHRLIVSNVHISDSDSDNDEDRDSSDKEDENTLENQVMRKKIHIKSRKNSLISSMSSPRIIVTNVSQKRDSLSTLTKSTLPPIHTSTAYTSTHNAETADSKYYEDQIKIGKKQDVLHHHISFFIEFITKKIEINPQAENTVLCYLSHIKQMNLTLSEITDTLQSYKEYQGIFVQLKEYIPNTMISQSAKDLIKQWKKQNAQAIADIQNTPITTTTTTTAVTTTIPALIIPNTDSLLTSDILEIKMNVDSDTSSKILNLPPIQYDTYDINKLPSYISTNIARRRAIRLLMSTSLPHLHTALLIEKVIYKFTTSNSSSCSNVSSIKSNTMTSFSTTSNSNTTTSIGNNNNNNSSSSTHDTDNSNNHILLATNAYLNSITRISYGLMEPGLKSLRDRLICTCNTMNINDIESDSTTYTVNDDTTTWTPYTYKEVCNICTSDVSKLQQFIQ